MLPNRTEVACSNRAIKLSIEVVDSAWSEEEDKILRENYPSMGGKVCKLLPGRTRTSCMARAGMFCIRSNRSVRPWTNEEDNIIRENYPSMGKGVHKLLSDRTPVSCSHRAVTLNIKCNSKSWSEEEDKILRENYPSMGRKVAELLPGRSKEACIDRANKILKIKYNRK
jgi:hypothetical protein